MECALEAAPLALGAVEVKATRINVNRPGVLVFFLVERPGQSRPVSSDMV